MQNVFQYKSQDKKHKIIGLFYTNIHSKGMLLALPTNITMVEAIHNDKFVMLIL